MNAKAFGEKFDSLLEPLKRRNEHWKSAIFGNVTSRRVTDWNCWKNGLSGII